MIEKPLPGSSQLGVNVDARKIFAILSELSRCQPPLLADAVVGNVIAGCPDARQGSGQEETSPSEEETSEEETSAG